jgi:hypothetical protein
MRLLPCLAVVTLLCPSLAFAEESLPPLPGPEPAPVTTAPSAPSSPTPPTATSISTSPPAPTPTLAATRTPAPGPSDTTPGQAGAYRHDGFYLRAALGWAYGWLSGSGPYGSASVSGSSAALLLAIGGTPAKGLVVAGTVMGQGADGDLAGTPPGSSRSVTTVAPIFGVLVDWYPAPEGGWHVGGSLGLGGVGLTDASSNSNGYSLGVAILGGYDWWIGPQWSLGLMAVAATAGAADLKDGNGSDTGYRFTPITIAIEGSIVFH